MTTKNIDNLFTTWQQLSDKLVEAKELAKEELQARKHLAFALIKKEDIPTDASEVINIVVGVPNTNAGVRVKSGVSISLTDHEQLLKQLPQEIIDTHFKLDLRLSQAEYVKLSPEHQEIVDKYSTRKLTSPTINIEEQK